MFLHLERAYIEIRNYKKRDCRQHYGMRPFSTDLGNKKWGLC